MVNPPAWRVCVLYSLWVDGSSAAEEDYSKKAQNVSINDLKEQLLKKPFDNVLRARFAEALITAELWKEAAEQLEILSEQDALDAGGVTRLALCHLHLNSTTTARNIYGRAKGMAGFSPQADLEALAAEDASSTPHLSLAHSVEVPPRVLSRSTISFADIGGMADVKKTLRMQIIEPFLKPGLFAKFRKKAGGGILLYGPPGCGKTMMARAVATECGLNFLSVGVSDILNMYIGESEQNLAAMFDKARSERPCLMFFDELDALAFSRSKAGSEHSRTIVNEFLSQLDGFGEDNDQILMLAATNMPWDVDSAMKRPGRFARQIFVPPPDQEARVKILALKLADVPCDPIDYRGLAARLEFFSGADIDGLIELAKEAALTEMMERDTERNLSWADFESVIDDIIPSTADWLRTTRNLVTYAGTDKTYKAVEIYLKKTKFR